MCPKGPKLAIPQISVLFDSKILFLKLNINFLHITTKVSTPLATKCAEILTSYLSPIKF
jgi:hypothetical protein